MREWYEQWAARRDETPVEVAEERACTPDAVRKLETRALAKLAMELEARFGPA